MAKDPKLNPKIEGFTFADGACKRFSFLKKTNNKCLVLYGNSVQIYRFIWFGKNSMTWNYFRTLKECMAGNKNIFCGYWSVQCHSILFRIFYCILFGLFFSVPLRQLQPGVRQVPRPPQPHRPEPGRHTSPISISTVNM